MISCTEFIPFYSEFFKYLENTGGQEAVMQYWYYISDNSIGDKSNPNSLAYKCERLGGFEGAKAYWGHTLTEEACDLFEVTDRKEKYCYSHMRHCPSRGMLNALKHVEPYRDYCEHCKIIYSRVLQKYGVVYERDHSKIANAECSSLLYEEGNRPDINLKNVTDKQMGDIAKEKGAEIVDLKSEDNKYLHRDFHLLGDTALKYCGDKFGDEAVCGFLRDYAKYYYAPQIQEFKKDGLSSIEEWLKRIYETEEAAEVLHTKLSDNVLTVTVDKSPVIEYMYSLGQKPSKYYVEETRTLYDEIAKESGFKFELEYYNTDGAARYRFFIKRQLNDKFNM